MPGWTLEAVTGFDDIDMSWWDALPGPATSPFLRLQWFALWAESFLPPGTCPIVFVASARGRPEAALPTFRRRRLLCTLSNAHSPAFDAVYSVEGAHLVPWLAASLCERGALCLSGIDADSELARVAGGMPGLVLDRDTFESPFLYVPHEVEDLLRDKSAGFRSLLRRRIRQLASLGEVTFEMLDGSADLTRLLDEGFAVEASGWKGRAGSAISSHRSTEAFYRRLAAAAVADGTLRLAFLRLDQRAIAFAYHLQASGRLHLLKTGFCEEFGRHSPGFVLAWRILEWCVRNGVRAYEFGGRVEPWKQAWAGGSHSRLDLVRYPPSAKGLLEASAHRTYRTLRSAIAHAPAGPRRPATRIDPLPAHVVD